VWYLMVKEYSAATRRKSLFICSLFFLSWKTRERETHQKYISL
jgi:hypothetical protein